MEENKSQSAAQSERELPLGRQKMANFVAQIVDWIMVNRGMDATRFFGCIRHLI
jgi:hypothetical protein